MAEPHIPEQLTIPSEHALSVFVSAADVRKPGEMVYLDFVQIDVAADPPGHATVVARLVFTPSLAATLIAKLSEVVPAQAG